MEIAERLRVYCFFSLFSSYACAFWMPWFVTAVSHLMPYLSSLLLLAEL